MSGIFNRLTSGIVRIRTGEFCAKESGEPGTGKTVLAEEIASAKKQGFSAPDASWFKGESIDFVRRQLFEGSPRIYEFLDRAAVKSLVSEHLEGRQNRRLFIWSLLNIEQWLAQYL